MADSWEWYKARGVRKDWDQGRRVGVHNVVRSGRQQTRCSSFNSDITVNCKWCILHLQTQQKLDVFFFYAVGKDGAECSEIWVKVMGEGLSNEPKNFTGRDRAESIEKCQQLKTGISCLVWFVLLFTYSWISSRFKSNWNILHCNPVRLILKLPWEYKFKSGSATQVRWALYPGPLRK